MALFGWAIVAITLAVLRKLVSYSCYRPPSFNVFLRIENNLVVEIQAIWDIPEMMMVSNA
jgi:hypothetical protein